MSESAPKIAFFAAFESGFEILSFVLDHPYRPALVATSARDDSPYEERIFELCGARDVDVLRDVDVNDPAVIDALRCKAIDLAVLAWWPSILKMDAIDAVPRGWINLHPSLLPYNRGKHPYYWSIVEGTPFGVTIHLVDEGIDSGPILFQKRIDVTPADTGETLYDKGRQQVVQLFKDHLPEILAGDLHPVPQDESIATRHFAKQLDAHSRIDLDRTYTARELIDIVRARTFMKGDSAYFVENGRRYRVKLVIEEEAK